MSAGVKSEIDIEDLRGEKIISFSRQNLSYSERCFAEKFEEHDLTDDVNYTRDDTFSLMSLVSAGLGVGFVPDCRARRHHRYRTRPPVLSSVRISAVWLRAPVLSSMRYS